MLAAADIVVEEQEEKLKDQEADLAKIKRENEQLQKQAKELEALKAKVKNMESEHRLLKRDFDLVFATNKSVQKKMERAELENHALRKTIVTLANQIEKIEREKNDGMAGFATTGAVIPLQMANDALNTQIPCSPKRRLLLKMIRLCRLSRCLIPLRCKSRHTWCGTLLFVH
eukprot:TRINITY_DN1955_c0_g1_i1.p1 TRINITY_DN1955_c0_g1~~TRINITY_DN1955_c0_g1_i1.p1  ORF type:complete len:172 (+),score=27.98 TRINITY_DN1955_c0_g1_i1:202-717(+)